MPIRTNYSRVKPKDYFNYKRKFNVDENIAKKSKKLTLKSLRFLMILNGSLLVSFLIYKWILHGKKGDIKDPKKEMALDYMKNSLKEENIMAKAAGIKVGKNKTNND